MRDQNRSVIALAVSLAVAASLVVAGRAGLAAGDPAREPAVVDEQAGGGTVVGVVAIADAHVRSGHAAATNFGSSPTLEVKTDGVYGYDREAYLTFPLPGAMDPRHATVRLTTELKKGSLALAVHQVQPDPHEVFLTWAGRPPMGDLITSQTVSGPGTAVVDLDVSEAVAAARAAGLGTLTIGLRATSRGEPLLRIASREAATTEDRPLLLLRHP